MLFRGRQPEASIWRRFRASTDGFTFSEADGVYTAHVVANAERVVDLFWSLSDLLSPAVDMHLEDLRSGRSWKGEALALPDVRDMIARLRLLLARFGGTEMSVYNSEDQFSLTANLELYVYSRSDKWLYLLEGRGLEERQRVQPKSWKINRQSYPAAPDLVTALAAAVERLGLQRA
ncbi:MAG: hypothetical protein ACHQRK_02035 [Gemmatimonadales bacterium]|jgi:hypothetical protein